MEKIFGIILVLMAFFSYDILEYFKINKYVNKSNIWKIINYAIESILIIFGLYLFNEYHFSVTTSIFFIFISILGGELRPLLKNKK